MVRLSKADMWDVIDFQQYFIETKLEIIIKTLVLRTKLRMAAICLNKTV